MNSYRNKIVNRVVPAIAFAVLVASAPAAYATHFRYGHITWTPLNGTTVEFRLQNAWRRTGATGFYCVDPATLVRIACTGGDGLAGVGDVTVEFQGATVFDPGDGGGTIGSPVGPLLYQVTSIDPANDWLFGLALDPSSLPAVDTTIEHTYPAPGPYTAHTSSCCRILRTSVNNTNRHINNPSGFYRVETLVDVGSGNSSPVSVLEPIQVCGIDTICEILVRAADAEGDPLSFRLSASAEAASVGAFLQPGEPGSGAPNPASIEPTTGLYTWDTTGATVDGDPLTLNTLYSTQVTIEGGGNKSALDFLIRLTTVDPEPPEFDPDQSPVCETTQVVTVGRTKTFDVVAFDPDPDDTVQLNAVGLPVGATMMPTLPISGNPVSSSFSWTPAPEQVGVHVVSFAATSSGSGIGQTKCGVTIEVVETLIVGIDIKPFSDPNGLNPESQGVVPVAILTSETFDATTVDTSTVRFGVNGAIPVHYGGHIEDADEDGDLDLVLHFDTQDTGILCGDVSATLAGQTFDGQPIEGSDVIKTAGCE